MNVKSVTRCLKETPNEEALHAGTKTSELKNKQTNKKTATTPTKTTKKDLQKYLKQI